jgi:hypothetical protein
MYHLEFRGHLFREGIAFRCEAVGYMYGNKGHTYNSSWCDGGAVATDGHAGTVGGGQNVVDIESYCSPISSNLVFRLEDENNLVNEWHASGITIDFFGTASVYHERMARRLNFTEMAHHPDAMIW